MLMLILRNIFIDDQGTIKIGELGTAKDIIKTLSFMHDKSITAESKASLPYMSPEMFASHVQYDFRTDMWSFGCVIYEMLTFDKVFDLMTKSKDPLNELPKSVPEEFDIILKKYSYLLYVMVRCQTKILLKSKLLDKREKRPMHF
jgi:serine/threonine protein kinase